MSVSSVGGSSYNTTQSGSKISAGVQAYVDAQQKGNTGLWQMAQDHWGKDAAQCLAGYEQWIENQALNVVQKCSDDMGKNDG